MVHSTFCHYMLNGHFAIFFYHFCVISVYRDDYINKIDMGYTLDIPSQILLLNNSDCHHDAKHTEVQ